MSAIGSQSFTNRITAQSFSQPYFQVGTLAAPLPIAATTTLTYDPAYNKYIMYMVAPATTVSIATVLRIAGCPVNLAGTSTIAVSTDWILSGATPTVANVPIILDCLSVKNDTVVPTSSEITFLAVAISGAVFSSGSPVFKMIITINLD